MGAEQSNKRTNTHFVYVRQEERERQLEEQRKINEAIENQRRLYDARIKLVEAEAAKAKQEAEAKAAEARAAQAKVAAQAQALHRAAQAQATHTQYVQAQTAQAQALHTQAARIAQAETVSVGEALWTTQAQPIETRAAPVISPSTPNSFIFERSRSPYSLSSNELQQNRNTNSPNLYPSLDIHNYPSTSNAANRNQSQQNNNFNRDQANNVGNDFGFVSGYSAPPSAPQRERSISRTRGSNNNADDDIRCPTCRNTYGTKIFQCPSGHSSCSNCREHGARCGKCNQVITDMRNITLEDYVSERKVRCPYHADGCKLFVKNSEVESHLWECPFGMKTCPLHPRFKHCTWKGKVSQLSSHFNDVHPDFNQADVDTEMVLLNIRVSQESLHFVTIGNFNFLFFVKVYEQERKICMAAQLIGTQISAMKWNYEVHIYNKRQPRRKFQFSDICSSSSTSIDEIFNDAKCVNIPLQYALTFFNNGCVAYKFFIKKTNDGREQFNFGERGRGHGRGRGRGRGGAYHKN